MMELSDYRRGLFQWDTGRSLIVTEKDITEVHFQLLPPPSGSTETTDVPVTDGIAQIPDELLQVGLPLRAYAWGDGYSHYDQTFCVTKREKPTGYASEPADAITLESVQAKLQAEIDGKIQMPQGGDAGDVLKKTDAGVEWEKVVLSGTSDEFTPTQVYQAVLSGTPAMVKYESSRYGELYFTNFNIADDFKIIVSQTIANFNGEWLLVELWGNYNSTDPWRFSSAILATKIIRSSTPGSMKEFVITVDDTGTLSATEVT